ncbi:MAG: hypothetical protein N2249_04755 [Melioribacter sp.]|nr:hypothetical protein [Melioribacter sp.]
MNLYLPNNIFASIFEAVAPLDSNIKIIKKDSALLAKQLLNDEYSIALIPSLELINVEDLFISSKVSISFDGLLSHSYFYFTENERVIDKVFVRADATINEIILTKILFAERYNIYPEIILDTSSETQGGRDYLVCGNENFIRWHFSKGISFADEISDLIDLPYVNFIFASQNKESLENFNKHFEDIDRKIEDNIEKILLPLSYSENAKNFIIENLGSVYYEFTDNEIEALRELIKLLYYHEVIDDIFDLNFV